jgi:hypothetical protein
LTVRFWFVQFVVTVAEHVVMPTVRVMGRPDEMR